MLQCTPFLLFDGNCAEAMTFYHQGPGGELTLTKPGDTPMKDQFPPEKHNRMINAHLKSGALEFSATDWMASPAFEPKLGNTFAIFVVGGTYDELKAVFDKLAERAHKDWFQDLHDIAIEAFFLFSWNFFSIGWIYPLDWKAFPLV
jgi:PhnB protein